MADEKNRQESIHAKGFDLYGRIKVGKKYLEDATLDIDNFRPGNFWAADKMYTNKTVLARALHEKDLEMLRNISNYYYNMSGIYQKVCNYFATMYRYDWYVVPEIFDENIKEDKILDDFSKLLNYLDDSHIQKLCADIALKVIKNGAYYGYIVELENSFALQDLPLRYCRHRYSVGGLPAIEFNMAYFDEQFPNTAYRQKVLKLWPKEFQIGYAAYKRGELVDDIEFPTGCWGGHHHHHTCRATGWYLLDPGLSIKFSFNNGDIPLFINSVPAILDLDNAEALDRQRQAQQLKKIIVQKLPLDKNSDLVFDVDEAKDIHANAVAMLRNTFGIDVITTFAEVEDIDLSEASEASDDAVDNAVDAVYRTMGITENLFDTDGNLSTEKSILIDEAAVRTLLLQFNTFFDRIVRNKNKKPKKYRFKLYMLETTQNNYKELSDKYKGLVQLGYSKMLPQIALGHSQSSILNTAYFENEILNLNVLMLPPLQSSVMNAETLQALGKQAKGISDAVQGNTEDSKGGRPEKADSEKSEKTIQNLESKS